MAVFEVNPSKIKQQAEVQEKISIRLDKLDDQIRTCNNQLKSCMEIKSYSSIQKYLQSVSQRTEKHAKSVRNMASILQNISELYKNTENEIKGISVKHEEVNKGDAKADLISRFSKIIKNADDNSVLAIIASIMSLYNSGYEVGNSESIAELYSKILGTSGDVLDFAKEGYDGLSQVGSEKWKNFLKKYTPAMDIAGIGADGLGFANAFLDTYNESESIADFLKSDGKVIGSGVSWWKDIKELGGTEVGTGKAAAITSMFSMGSYAIGDTMDMIKTGDYSGQNIADAFMGTGFSGLNELLSSYTHGAIEIDTESSLNIFNKNIAATTDVISKTNWGTGAQAALGIAATPVVAVWSMGEVFVDIGYGIGESINKLIWNK